MDNAGLNWTLIDIVGAGILLVVMLIVVAKTRSRGKQDSSPATEQATRELYAEEEADRRSGDEA